MSQAAVARRSGILPDTLSKIERGSVGLSFNTFADIADTLRIPARTRTQLMRRSWPRLFQAPPGDEGLPDELLPADIEMLELMPTPALIFEAGTWDVLALNDPSRAATPGLEAAGNAAIWLFNDPRAHEIIVNWQRVTHMAVTYLHDNAPEWYNRDRFEQIAAACDHDPRWSRMVLTPVDPPRTAPEVIPIRNLETGVVANWHQRFYRPESAARQHWRIAVYTPDSGAASRHNLDQTGPTGGR